MLAWCRKTSRRTIAEAAKVANVSEAKIADWERGKESPTFRQLTLLATLYKRPTCVFYLTEPPPDFTVMRDFRSHRSKEVRDFSPQLAFAIREARERSRWLSDFLRASEETPISFIRSCSLKSPTVKAGVKLRRALGMTLVDQANCRDKDAAFRLWRQKCEEAGVCVFMVGKIETAEMRGFVIVDEYAPVVAVNSKDSAAGKSFTLLHEMAHLLLGAEGISDVAFSSSLYADSAKVERFCNAVAAEVLVPSVDLAREFEKYGDDRMVATIQLAKRYQASEEVVARRLLEFGKVNKEFYGKIRAISAARAALAIEKEAQKPKEGQPIKQFRLTKSRVGTRFSKAAVAAFHEGDIDGFELSRLLGMKLDHLRDLESSLFPYHAGYGGGALS